MIEEEIMSSLAIIIALLMIAAGVLLTGFLLLLRDKYEKFTESSTHENVTSYGGCYDLCKGDSRDVAENCVGLCAYGWP